MFSLRFTFLQPGNTFSLPEKGTSELRIQSTISVSEGWRAKSGVADSHQELSASQAHYSYWPLHPLHPTSSALYITTRHIFTLHPLHPSTHITLQHVTYSSTIAGSLQFALHYTFLHCLNILSALHHITHHIYIQLQKWHQEACTTSVLVMSYKLRW